MNHSVSIIASDALPVTTGIYCSEQDFKTWSKTGEFIKVIGENPYFAYKFQPHPSVKPGAIAMNSHQRVEVHVALNDVVKIELYPGGLCPTIALLSLVISFKHKKKREGPSKTVIGAKVVEIFKDLNGQLLAINQKVQLKYDQTLLFAQVQSMYAKGSKKGGVLIDENGLFTSETAIQLTPIDSSIVVVGGESNIDGLPVIQAQPPPINPDIPFDKIGVGGLGNEFRALFRRAFASRCLHPETVKKLGILHVRGILLYGPPGTGKTLLARSIAKILNANEPKRISGSDILSKWVGEAERQIRQLFLDAEAEQRDKGDYSSLHVVIIDELDAICRARSNSSSNIGDSIVNQLLSKMDGNDVLNNILIIGMTNRKDLIDRALLRPGRFEVLIEISLPSENGRKEILLIHTAEMRANERIEKDVDLDYFARESKNFSGAEIAGMVRSATSFALERCLDVRDPEEVHISEETVVITKKDFKQALKEIVPAFGKNRDQLTELLPQCGFITWSEEVKNLLDLCQKWINEFVASPVLRLMSLLMVGPPGSGKTTIAAYLGSTVSIPLVKVVSPEDFLGKSDKEVAGELNYIFKDLYKSPSSLLILDNIERLLSYSEIGHIYSNSVLQALLILTKKQPPTGKKLFIIGTTSDEDALKFLRVNSIFTTKVRVPPVFLRDGNSETIKTIQEIMVEVESDRHALKPEEFLKKLQKLGKPFEQLWEVEKREEKLATSKKITKVSSKPESKEPTKEKTKEPTLSPRAESKEPTKEKKDNKVVKESTKEPTLSPRAESKEPTKEKKDNRVVKESTKEPTLSPRAESKVPTKEKK